MKKKEIKKIIKAIKDTVDKDITYQLGYELNKGIVYPLFEICKGDKTIGGMYWYMGAVNGLFSSFLEEENGYGHSYMGDINDMFDSLRENIDVPIEVEKEFNDIFKACEKNDFKEKRED